MSFCLFYFVQTFMLAPVGQNQIHINLVNYCKDVGWSLVGFSDPTWVVEGPNTWDATGGHGPGDVRVGCLTMTDGLVA